MYKAGGRQARAGSLHSCRLLRSLTRCAIITVFAHVVSVVEVRACLHMCGRAVMTPDFCRRMRGIIALASL
jgi:hypothetical protein